MDEEESKELRIQAMELMLKNHPRRQMAEFMVNLDESVKGLGENNRALAKAYREALLKD